MMLNIQIDSPTSVNQENQQPKTFELYQNYPNPFNSSTTISYKLKNPSQIVKINIYDVNGNLIEKLFNGFQSNGLHSVRWDASNYSSGSYLARVETGNVAKVIKLVYLK